MFSWHPDTLGVYETQVPLPTRAIMDIGAVCQLNKMKSSVFRKTTNDAYDMTEFLPSQGANDHYMRNVNLRYVYMYHSYCDQRQVIGLFVPHAATCNILVFDPFKNNHVPNLDKLY